MQPNQIHTASNSKAFAKALAKAPNYENRSCAKCAACFLAIASSAAVITKFSLGSHWGVIGALALVWILSELDCLDTFRSGK